MYIGPDGKVYQNKFDSLGHSTKMPGYADEQFAINQRLAELRKELSKNNFPNMDGITQKK